MQEVLLQLALTSSTAAARMDADSGGGSVRYYSDSLLVGTLGPDEHGAPALFYARAYDAAETDQARQTVYEEARATLEAIRRSKGDPTKVETREELHARIVEHGEGWPARDVAAWAKTSVRIVHVARHEAGRDEEFGRPPANGKALEVGVRRAQVLERAELGMSARQIAFALSLPYSTVLRDLGRKS